MYSTNRGRPGYKSTKIVSSKKGAGGGGGLDAINR